MVSQRGIDANLEKIKALIEMRSPRTIKEVQQLTGRVATLNRFISRAIDKCLPFFKVFRQAFEWSTESEEAFQQLKQCLANPPLLSQALPDETLFLYLVVSNIAVSAALIREDNSVQRPVYYISRALKGAEQNYPLLEKMALTLVIASRCLRPYFQAHSIVVLTDQPLRKVMQQPELSGRLMQWSVELNQFEISYRPRTVIKGDSGAGLILTTLEGEYFKCALRFLFDANNNEAEYEALITGLRLARDIGVNHIQVFSDFQLIVRQITEEFDAKEETMRAYKDIAFPLVCLFNTFQIRHISRLENCKADEMAQLASADQSDLSYGVCIEYLTHPTTSSNPQEVHFLQNEPILWAQDILLFLSQGELPDDKQQAAKVRARLSNYIFIGGLLYKRGFSRPYLRCLSPAQVIYVMREIHEGICGNHSGARSLAHKILCTDYF
ncbi:uncharacterized protein LOC114265232 [Camellia sinensis]|uniref:uncharacterized protein LOC114265232 n=1 Tax=Camellia sinensis TaxID=4442 RepID=UPI001035CA20|nr:uncharacterized protein LOC114265232 [Camellia sinensis]